MSSPGSRGATGSTKAPQSECPRRGLQTVHLKSLRRKNYKDRVPHVPLLRCGTNFAPDRWPTHKPTNPPESGVPIHDAPLYRGPHEQVLVRGVVASWVGKHNPRPAGCCSSVRNCRRVPSTNSVPKPRIIPAQGNRGSQRQVFVAGVDHHPRSASAKYPEGRKPALFLVRSPNPIPWSLFPGPLAHPPAQTESAGRWPTHPFLMSALPLSWVPHP